MQHCLTRRRWMIQSAAASGALLAGRLVGRASAPSAPVAIAKCKTYDPSVLTPALAKIYDQIGGLGRIVKGKTVAIKINMTGAVTNRLGYLPTGDTHFTNPNVLAATIHLMGKAGARRIRILESPQSTADPLEEVMLQTGWEPRDFLSAARVEFENTNFLGQGKQYDRHVVPGGGLIYPAFELNHSYNDCDVFVSMAKPKEHLIAGVTISIKNLFGITPASIYGTGAGIDDPNETPRGGRQFVHNGARQPSKIALPEKDPSSPREPEYRMPRVINDLLLARPIDLAVVEGVKSMTGGEGPWALDSTAVSPGWIAAGTNAVNTDAVSMALMGFDPMAERGAAPFERCDSTVAIGEANGVGTRDLNRIDVRGVPIREAMFDFAAIRKQRPPTINSRRVRNS